jgi:hypothetical protein
VGLWCIEIDDPVHGPARKSFVARSRTSVPGQTSSRRGLTKSQRSQLIQTEIRDRPLPARGRPIDSPVRRSEQAPLQSGVFEVGLPFAWKGTDALREFAAAEGRRLRHRLSGNDIVDRTISVVQQHPGQAERSSWPRRQLLRQLQGIIKQRRRPAMPSAGDDAALC